ncbi:hypothetical protein A3A76_04300 [Candidatus Woesebacteria bacterium RIFCSPLOWO2_01_FULL_39_23]|uniref:Cohesin domain-containing protein n=1 Tax=Candidatus Woesebacteria bacterium RIFCSPHIGHO2_01_FULL_40_22 TaxID=1802499 RepID=A0A1F7YF58_9BACT|nr:MAG: hypothetical protein A2141_01865 [Candidatus Woesebacteria bacterium RBG_16_40_11]OGM25974.1 MAG: hypothetical protein A2628_00300 [Candidatus Woesebacteria bacterium RIFCSPHIGHO2_01_FULL_40_22]OGM38086.1 MAG: hypothetical protein A3E41_03385 [Candidatus Woesebacteria bacterium RIFCSPHIGHO2_12_FULL_38_9]OGM61823.1 MAG: hypothetical protein A3A76_04300 [Candidatus Woesebacteria bacterium RIFCSPLOWO2_01_FULL_39_23]
MKKRTILVTSLILASGLFLISKGSAFASEGTFELRSTNDNTYRCFAASLQMQNLVYKVTVSCRDILYPVDNTIFSYILWANPADASAPVKVGALGLGKAQFDVKPAFTSLFVTTEENPNTKAPAGNVVMKGSIKPITFLEKPGSPAPTSGGDEETTTPEETPTPKSSAKDRLLLGLKRAGLASGLALIAILGLVFVLTRPRG